LIFRVDLFLLKFLEVHILRKRRLATSHLLTSFYMSTIINTGRILLVYQENNIQFDYGFYYSVVNEEEE